MIFWVEITDVSSRCYKLLKVVFLSNKVRLCEQELSAAAVSLPIFTLKAFTLCQ